jgi:hypothetical protein
MRFVSDGQRATANVYQTRTWGHASQLGGGNREGRRAYVTTTSNAGGIHFHIPT